MCLLACYDLYRGDLTPWIRPFSNTIWTKERGKADEQEPTHGGADLRESGTLRRSNLRNSMNSPRRSGNHTGPWRSLPCAPGFGSPRSWRCVGSTSTLRRASWINMQSGATLHVQEGIAFKSLVSIGAASGDRTHDILSHSQAFCR
jgi:hypothetical protein